MDQVPLPDRSLSKCDHIEIVVLADRRMEVELASLLTWVHHGVVVLVPDLLLDQSVALVFLGVPTHRSSVLLFNLREVQDDCLFLLCLAIASDFAPS